MLPPAAFLPPLQSSSVQISEHLQLSVVQILRKSVCYIKQHKVCLRKPAVWSLNSAIPDECCGHFCIGFAISRTWLSEYGWGWCFTKPAVCSKKWAKEPSLALLRAAITDFTGWAYS